ncbi:DNA polymerase III subunit delta' [Sinirhodobacter sp. WL0062]|uniref:DNA polymerase III subunit delta n=1 Tax=Rhodobacter flavimaris TaxID=2907145 RepID=A0ABS8YV20_9RHOB|nr:DNA polymerase III subunit delta' [Sinirhodobacter sp. WL0062]MCE5972591.1 DNA polymerase III subunit delta' [Sinirhodobacter sp. WL0062]
MSSKTAEIPDPTQVEGAIHPRDTQHLMGQARAEADFLDAFTSGRMHHGWMLTGPRGVGKATLAWRIARFLLTQPTDDGGGLFGAPPPPTNLETDPEHPVCRRIHAGSEPGVFLLKRGLNATETGLSQDIRVDEVRKLKSFLHLSAAEGGRRVVIVDSADEMNTQAANALLKLLEEPPPRVTFLLISHQPAGLLPTIRSRCRELRLATLAPEDMAAALAAAGEAVEADTAALAALSGGSVGEAIRLLNLDGLATYEKLVALFGTLPRLDRVRALALADSITGKQNEPRYDLMLGLIELFLARLARAGVAGPPPLEGAAGEAQVIARLSPDGYAAMKWAALHQTLGARARHGKGVNLDPAALVMDMVLEITAAAA